MGVGRLLTLLAAGLLSIATAAPAFAAPVGAATPATGRAQLLYPVQVRRLQDLNFGYLGVTTAGTAVINRRASNEIRRRSRPSMMTAPA